jgi:sec-independent protein translocase protein TatC
MSFLDHLEDLRWLLVRSTLAIVIWLLPRFFAIYLFDTIIWSGTANIYNLSIFFVTYPLGLTDSFCITEFPYHPEYLHGGTGKCYLVCSP